MREDIKAQEMVKDVQVEIEMARSKHRAMKRAFKGIVSYPQRKLLFKVGQNYGK